MHILQGFKIAHPSNITEDLLRILVLVRDRFRKLVKLENQEKIHKTKLKILLTTP